MVASILWTVIARPHARDGDSMHLLRERVLFSDEVEHIIRRDTKPVLCRAQWLACPEISGPKKDPVNGPLATRDAQEWFDGQWEATGVLMVVQNGFEKYGRPLVDVRNTAGESFSQYMLQRGWQPYV